MVEPSGQVKAAGGLLIQMLPGARAGLAEMIEGKLARMNFISSLIESGLSPEMILEQLFAEFQLHILEKKELRFQCRCSKDKAASALIGLGKVELEEMLAEDHSVEVRCHFCGDLMEFSDEDLESFIAIAANQAADKPTMS
jgi:molecular chaperone Hsp33